MESAGYYLTFVSIYQTTWRHIPEDSNLHFTTSLLDSSLTVTMSHITDVIDEVWENKNH
jgi:hypothetical protein